ncbi:MAG TPA: diguanylate cyclase [Caproiciproducens sp.]|nr:diguanylate cyclase [Caproiciproducens sp.]
MESFSYLEVNLFALAVLLIIFVNIVHRSDMYMFDQKLYLLMITSNALLLALDTVYWVVNGKPGLYFLNLWVNILYFMLQPIPCLLWLLYADFEVYGNVSHTRKLILPAAVPTFLLSACSLMNFFGNYIFYIDSNNIYHRGRYFPVIVALTYTYLGLMFLFAALNYKRLRKQYLIPVVAFALLPFLGCILQCLFFGVPLIWVCMALSAFIIFVNGQHTQIYRDGLTGLSNRRILDAYFMELKHGHARKKSIAGIMVDIDSFKKINDDYGHVAGDRALQFTADIIKRSFRKDDLVTRYGGDEFVILMDTKNIADIHNAVGRMQRNVEAFNQKKLAPYRIGLSIGYDIVEWNPGMTAEQFINQIDCLMYREKNRKKEKRFGT